MTVHISILYFAIKQKGIIMVEGDKCKVIEFISSLGDGGAEILVKDYMLLTDSNRFELKLVTVYRSGVSACARQLKERNIPEYSLLPGNNGLYRFIKHTVGFASIPRKLYRIIREFQPDCIHVHMNQLHHLVPLIGKLNGIKVIYTCHNTPEQYFSGFSGVLERWAVQRFTTYKEFTLVALHNDMAKQLKDLFRYNNIIVIRNGIDFDRFANVQESKETIRKSLGIPNDAFVIGHVGRFVEQKNHAHIIDIFENYKKKNPEAFLLLVGSGPLENDIRSKVSNLKLDDSCLFLSHRSDIPAIMKAMDVFLFPSLYEGLPITLIEAQVSRLPCIVSDKVNSSAVLLSSTRFCSLEAPISTWVSMIDQARQESKVVCYNDELRKYDMKHEIKRLEKLYQG